VDAFVLGAVGAAEDFASRLNPMANYPTFAVRAARSHRVNGTLEAVERHRLRAQGDAEGLIVIVAANVTASHGTLLVSWQGNGDGRIRFHVPIQAPNPWDCSKTTAIFGGFRGVE
jgi:hypothetical protein